MTGSADRIQQLLKQVEKLKKENDELKLWAKEQPDFLAQETRLKNERDALKKENEELKKYPVKMICEKCAELRKAEHAGRGAPIDCAPYWAGGAPKE